MILDTHAWLFYAMGRPMDRTGLRRIEKARRAGALQIAAVTLWEVALLAQTGRISFAQPASDWFREALARTEVEIAPLDLRVALAAARLAQPLRDPADCQIAGTAIELGVPLATRDERILGHAELLGLDVVEI